MCEAQNFNELKSEVNELQEDLSEIITNWQNHFKWLAALNNDSHSNKTNLSKYNKIQNVTEILVNILRNWKKNFQARLNLNSQSLKYNFRIFLKWYFQKRESLILKKVDKLQSKFNKKLKKNHSRIVKYRENRFRVMAILGEEI